MSPILIDVIAIGLVLITSIVGMCKGFFATFLSLLGFVGTFVITYFFNGVILGFLDNVCGFTAFFQSFLGSTAGRIVAVVLTFVATFIAIKLVIFVLNKTFGKLFKGRALGGVNKFMGFLLGMFKGAAYVTIVLVGLNLASLIPQVKDWTTTTFAQTYVVGNVYNWVGNQLSNYLSTNNENQQENT